MRKRVARKRGRTAPSKLEAGRQRAAPPGRERLSPARSLRGWIGAWKFEPREYEKIQKLLYEIRHAE